MYLAGTFAEATWLLMEGNFSEDRCSVSVSAQKY